VAATLEIEGRPLDLRVLGKNKAPAGEPEAALEDIPLLGSRGMPVFTGSLGRIRRSESAAALARLDRSDVIYLDVFPAAGQGKAVSAELEKLSRRFRFSRADESVFIRYRGSLLLTLGLVLFLLYLSLGAQFESFTLPFILLLTVPFSLAGSGPLLFLSGLSPDSGTVLGLTALFGLSVNNAIVLYEISVEKRNRGVSPSAAVYSGALERLRPMLISTATTLFALLPLVISPLGNSQRSMALAMLGGMGFSLVFTLFALPPVFVRFLEREKPHG
jgi:multidrug efflux pump subunit AcrB